MTPPEIDNKEKNDNSLMGDYQMLDNLLCQPNAGD